MAHQPPRCLRIPPILRRRTGFWVFASLVLHRGYEEACRYQATTPSQFGSWWNQLLLRWLFRGYRATWHNRLILRYAGRGHFLGFAFRKCPVCASLEKTGAHWTVAYQQVLEDWKKDIGRIQEWTQQLETQLALAQHDNLRLRQQLAQAKASDLTRNADGVEQRCSGTEHSVAGY